MENNNLILTKENFLKIFDLVKILKKNIIQVRLSAIDIHTICIEVYGTDSDLSSLSYIVYEYSKPDNPNLIIKDWGLNDDFVIYNFEKNAIVNLIKEDRIGYIQNNIIYDQFGYQCLWIGDNIYKDRLDALITKAFYIVRGEDPYSINTNNYQYFNNNYKYAQLRKIYEVDDIRKNVDISDSLKLKSADGSNMVNIDNNILTMYGSMYPITSKDKASLELYESIFSKSIISVVTIIKPKNITIKCIVRYRSLID